MVIVMIATDTTTALFLLLHKDSGAPEQWGGSATPLALTGALFADLTLAGRVTVQDKHLQVLDASATGDPMLDEALARFASAGGKKLSTAIQRLSKGMDAVVGTGMASRGLVSVTPGSFLRPTRYPIANPLPEQQVRDRLAQVLRGDAPTPSERIVLGILHAADLHHRILAQERAGVSLRRRLKEIEAQGDDPVSASIRHAIDEINAAANAAIVSATIV